MDIQNLKEAARTAGHKLKGECIFCSIAEEGEKTVFENKDVAAFPPLKSGRLAEDHFLVVPREHFEDIYSIPEEELADLTKTVKTIAQRLEEKGFEGVNILHASGEAAQQSVNHFHFHLVPRRKDDNQDLWPETGYKAGNSDEEVYKE
ncbi:MAG: HIT family protein, partial [Candidatus Nanohaloarchaea archaeon]